MPRLIDRWNGDTGMPPPDGALGTKTKAKVSQQDRVEIVKRVVKAWEAAGVDVGCELCGQPDWVLVSTDQSDGVALPVRLDAAVELGQCYLAYALQCKRCGNIRMMGKQRVEELAASVDASEG